MFYGGTQADKLQRRYRRFYAADGSMEISFDALGNKTTFVTYMGGDAYGAPAIWHSEQGSATTEQYFYLFRDYLGSILAITDSAGVIQEKRIFDAWGEVVKLTDANNNVLSNFVILDRGYTGHEHLLGVGLVHMNGRLYDPKLHRFLMPDNYVQDSYNTQNFNRYGYVLNNPLSYTDASGELSFKQFVGFVITIAAVLLAAVVAYAIVFTSILVAAGVTSLLGTTVGITTGIMTFSVLTYSAIVAFDFIGKNLDSFVDKINDPEQQRFAFVNEQSYFGITKGVKNKYFNENFIIQNTPEFSLSIISKK